VSASPSILHLTRDFAPRYIGGLSRVVTELVRACHGSKAARCAVISFDGWRPHAAGPGSELALEEQREGAPVLRLDRPAQLPALEPFARSFTPQLIVVHDAMLWDAGQTLAQTLATPVVYTAHVLHAEMARLRGLERETLAGQAEARALGQADAVFAPSRFVERALLAGSVSPRSVACTPLGLDDSAEARASVARRQAEALARPTKPGPGMPPPQLLVAGRFADVNGTAEVCELLPELLSAEPELQVFIAGGIPESPKRERRWRRRFAAALDPLDSEARQRVELCGWLDGAQLAQRYAAATLLLAPSWIETFGLSIAEAQLFGVPVITCGGSATDERVVDGETGLLCALRAPAELRTAIARLLGDPSFARRLGLEAAERASRDSWSAVLPEHLAAYAELL
jgi:glycosyltransferase involved in cell wall biosynthesis